MPISKPMTKVQLKNVVAEYAATFPGWTMFDGIAFVREHGPIRQMIWFQAMSSGSYRPTSVVIATPLPQSSMLTQMPLNPRTVDYKSHDRKWREMLTAMEQQFTPDIRKPLDIAEVLELCKAEARETTSNFGMLAILYAWLDRKEEALDCCVRMQSCAMPTLAPIPEWEELMKVFGRALAEAVEAGRARDFLEDAKRMETIGKAN